MPDTASMRDDGFQPQFAALIEHFQTGALSHDDWHHTAHLAVAVWYIEEYGRDRAIDELRVSICELNGKHGVENTKGSGYHESITRFWVYVVHGFLQRLPGDLERFRRADAVVAEFGPRRDLFKRYYCFDLVRS